MSQVRYVLNGEPVTREEFLAGAAGVGACLESGKAPDGPSLAGWPKTSDSLAVHPKQRAAAVEEANRLGVPTHYDALGRPVLTSQRHLDELAKKLGYTDRGTKVINRPYRGEDYIP